jgi:phage shock protein A
MDPLVMVGAWAGAILALAGVGRLAWRAFVAAVEAVIEKAIGRVWTDMDQIESRLDRLEQQVADLRERLRELQAMMQAYIQREQ